MIHPSLWHFPFHLPPPHVLHSLGPWLYLIVFAVSLIESTPIIGTFTPGTILLLSFGVLSSQGYMFLAGAIVAAAVGGITGDTIAYYIGLFGRHIINRNKKIVERLHLQQGQQFFEKYGGESVFFARFVGPVRPIIPILAGIAQMPIKNFLKWNISGSFVWATLYISLGFVFGDKWRVVASWLSNAGKIGAIVIVLLIIFYIIYNRNRKHKETR